MTVTECALFDFLLTSTVATWHGSCIHPFWGATVCAHTVLRTVHNAALGPTHRDLHMLFQRTWCRHGSIEVLQWRWWLSGKEPAPLAIHGLLFYCWQEIYNPIPVGNIHVTYVKKTDCNAKNVIYGLTSNAYQPPSIWPHRNTTESPRLTKIGTVLTANCRCSLTVSFHQPHPAMTMKFSLLKGSTQ